MTKIENRKTPQDTLRWKSEKPRFCQGSVYIIVLSVSMMVTVIGMACLFSVRVQRRAAEIAEDCAQARICARSAIELGLLYVQDPNWRSTRPNGTWLSSQPLGSGNFSLQGIDPIDGDLANNEYNPLKLTGIGTKGIACHKTRVTLTPVIKPLEALNTCLHASGQLKILAGKQITAGGAPVSTNGQLDNDGKIDGDAQAGSVADTGTITGSLTVPADSKQIPGPNVISDYISKATAIAFPGIIDKKVLAPGYNPWGATNPDGVYFIDTAGNDLTIRNSRIHGTLIVRLGSSKKLTLDNAVFMHNYRSDYPVLIVEGEIIIKCPSYDYQLSEVSAATNYNPSGAPYLGVSDDDKLDEYPNEIRGLVHIKGSLKLQQNARIAGAVICEGPVSCEGLNTIIHKPELYAIPPEGYTFVDILQISPESWKQVVE